MVYCLPNQLFNTLIQFLLGLVRGKVRVLLFPLQNLFFSRDFCTTGSPLMKICRKDVVLLFWFGDFQSSLLELPLCHEALVFVSYFDFLTGHYFFLSCKLKWSCNTPIKSHQNEWDPKIVQVWNCTTKDDLKELISTTDSNNMHLLFGNPSLQKFIVKLLGLEQL